LANTTTGLSLNSPRPGGFGRTMTPRKISNWKKGEMIGRGQFGKVYVGLLETGQWIAVKQMDIKNDEDEQHVKNMEKEVQLMERLRHENIVSLLGTQRDGQHFYILMEYVAGKSLDVLLKNFGPFPEVTIKWYTLQLVRALEFMHTHNIIHRDIKGKNILVDTNGNLKIADFGSAKQVDNFKKDTPTLSYNYTPLWTAPEVVTSGNYDRKVDIWALGCVIIEMGSAKLPWSECKFENPFQILFHIGNATSHPELPNELSETCKDFIKKCLTRDPDERPDASELLNHPFLNEMDGEEIPVDIEDL
jgi:serine/threonine protein kinase